MIVWLASYPRSGNTLLRTLLKDSFGLQTHSAYDDKSDIGDNLALASRIGHQLHGLPQSEFIRTAQESGSTYYVKTHDLPSDRARAIYVVRDGRAAVVSYQHYLKSFASNEVPLVELLLGFDQFVSWSEHVESWMEGRSDETLLLHYEALVADPEGAMTQVAEHLGLGAPRPARADFAELNALSPNFFRKGDNEANINELGSEEENLFWLLHGPTMQKLGYVETVPPVHSDVLRTTLLRLRTQRRADAQRLSEWINLAESWRQTAEERASQLEAASASSTPTGL
jgi:hypothetical protein